MAHFVRRQNLPFSIEDIKQVSASCPVCAELKPRFYGAAPGRLIKATSPFERLNIDFKGPLPTETNNKYILKVPVCIPVIGYDLEHCREMSL